MFCNNIGMLASIPSNAE